MEELLKEELGATVVKKFGHGGGGCISSGHGYDTENGKIFAKMNSKEGSKMMFDGEAASLNAIYKTDTVQVPKPLKVFDNPKGGTVLVMEYVDMKGLSKHAATLGEQLARMHLHNEEVGKRLAKRESLVHKEEQFQYVEKFGFHAPTCCGFIPQNNSWEEDWATSYAKRLNTQLDLIEKNYQDKEARELWSQLMPLIPKFFKDLDVKPALLHGDLWGGNAAETTKGPVIFDAASFYGHHEYELGIAGMFGGFGSTFYSAYHKIIPKSNGFKERHELYQLFHYLNHWNHFGSGYRGQSISIMKALTRSQ